MLKKFEKVLNYETHATFAVENFARAIAYQECEYAGAENDLLSFLIFIYNRSSEAILREGSLDGFCYIIDNKEVFTENAYNLAIDFLHHIRDNDPSDTLKQAAQLCLEEYENEERS